MTRSPAATAPTRCSAAPATTTSTATSAPTPPSSGPATTPSSGIPATAATPSKARRGKDALAFNGSNAAENIDVTANGSRVRLTRNVAGITMDLDAIESTNIRALGSADNITVDDLAGTDLKAANVDLSATGGDGDGAADSVIVNGSDKAEHVRVNTAGAQVLTTGLAAQTTIAGSEAALDTLRVNTLGGRDDVQVAPDVSTLIAPVVDLGADQ